ncbi:HAD family hydrolase [Halomarina ordinaria]|uniref:HAD family hydrolase n=1 Tax=Halomarina ordinaria TaxID=3033939 RepID=A0ABD5U8A6_9EURY|nr:HAD family hydrolase [Halomarina sp. PSRA2]
MTVSTVLFDLDDTLCEYRRSPQARLTAAFDRAGVDPYCTPTDLRAALPTLDPVETDREFYASLFAAAAEGTAADSLTATRVARAYEAVHDHTDVRFRAGAAAALSGLAGYDVGLVTNGGREVQSRKLAALDIADAFDVSVFATPEYGLKPNAYPFERALSALDTSPGDALYVGNSLRADVAGARRVGMPVAWFPATADYTRDPDPTPDYTLDTLADLHDVL